MTAKPTTQLRVRLDTLLIVLRVRVRVLVPEAIARVERGRNVHVPFVLCAHRSGPSLAVSPNGLSVVQLKAKRLQIPRAALSCMRVKTNAQCACKHVPCHAHGIHNYMYVWCCITLPLVDSFIQTVRDAVTTGFPAPTRPRLWLPLLKRHEGCSTHTHVHCVSKIPRSCQEDSPKDIAHTASIGSIIVSLHMP